MKRLSGWLSPWAAGLVLAGLIVRCWSLTNTGLWYDESFTLLVSRLPLPSLLAATMGDVHPPAYYLLTSLALGLLPSLPAALVLRGLSVLLGLGCLLSAHYLTYLLQLPQPGRVAALAMLAFAPAEIFYAQEGRMYALLQLMVISMVIMLYQRRWLSLGVFTLITIYTHNYGLIYAGLVGLVGLLRDRQLAWNVITAMGLPFLGWLPWAAVLAGQMGQVAAGYWIPQVNAGAVALAVYTIVVGTQVPSVGVMIAFISQAAALVFSIWHGLKNRWYMPVALLVGPVLLVAAVSVIWKPILLFRGFYPSLPFLAILAGAAFMAASTPAGRVGRWLLLVPWVLALGWQLGAAQIGAVKSWVVWPNNPTPAGAVVVHLDDTSLIYGLANWPGSQHYLLDSGCPQLDGQLSTSTRAALGIKHISPAQLPAKWYFAAVVEPLSNKCHEELFKQLSAQGQPVFSRFYDLGAYGVWYEQNSHIN